MSILEPERAACPSSRYLVEVEGELGAEWAPWFGAETLHAVGGRTRLELRVADQAQLHGTLRRIHDLHLAVVSLERIDDRSIQRPTREGGSHDQA